LLQDVSDLLEKEPEKSVKVVRLESNGWKVIRRDWSKHITEALRAGTTVYIIYIGTVKKVDNLYRGSKRSDRFRTATTILPLFIGPH